jgi:hypothetical protein
MKQTITKIERYLNPVAQLHLDAQQTYKVFVAGRGSGKSFTNGLKQAKKLALMPRSCGLFGSPTYSMIYTKTLIPMVAAWDQHMGYIEGVHYVVGKAPPKHFEKPYHKPRRYENVVSWWNGRIVVFASFDRPELISGGSYDDVDTDEAYLIEKSDYDDYVIPSLRGTHTSFKRVPIHRQHSFTSSMPYRNQGDWLLDFLPKSKQNQGSYHFIGWDPDPNVKVQLGSTYMNHHVLGKKAIEDMKLEMDVNSFRVMIENKQVTNFGNTFYPSLSKKHFYTPIANEKLINVPINHLPTLKRDASYDIGNDDYNPDKPLHISHDWESLTASPSIRNIQKRSASLTACTCLMVVRIQRIWMILQICLQSTTACIELRSSTSGETRAVTTLLQTQRRITSNSLPIASGRRIVRGV